MREELVIISRIDNGLALPDPFLLTTGIYDAEPWVSRPYGIDVEYRLFDDNSTGGNPSEFISQFYLFNTKLCKLLLSNLNI